MSECRKSQGRGALRVDSAGGGVAPNDCMVLRDQTALALPPFTRCRTQPMKKNIYILDPGLKSVGGHYFEYARSIIEATERSRVGCVVACHEAASKSDFKSSAVYPIYSCDVWAILPGKTYHSLANLRGVSEHFMMETRDFFCRLPPQEGDVIFMPNIAKAHVLAAALLAEEYGPRGAHLCFMFRYPSHFFDGTVAKEAFRCLEAVAAVHPVSLCTDSHRLADELAKLSSLPFRVLPIPHAN